MNPLVYIVIGVMAEASVVLINHLLRLGLGDLGYLSFMGSSAAVQVLQIVRLAGPDVHGWIPLGR